MGNIAVYGEDSSRDGGVRVSVITNDTSSRAPTSRSTTHSILRNLVDLGSPVVRRCPPYRAHDGDPRRVSVLQRRYRRHSSARSHTHTPSKRAPRMRRSPSLPTKSVSSKRICRVSPWSRYSRRRVETRKRRCRHRRRWKWNPPLHRQFA